MTESPITSRDFGRMEGKIDSILEWMRGKDEMCAGQNTRISRLEQAHYKQKGAIWMFGVLGGVVVAAIHWLVDLFVHRGN